ncbi:MAG: SMC-Scp complex subunit ScpB [Candidatus Omnitrophica bacterium]|nr:SMC-Scp complex subunit ScpB [Candidatus Omnitrophota bacterium]
MNKEELAKQKEREAKLKELREELEEKLEEQLPQSLKEGPLRIVVESLQAEENLEPARARLVIEALLFASSKPLTVPEIRKAVKSLTPSQIEKVLSEIREEYVQASRPFEVLEIAGGWEIATKKEFAPWILKIELARKAKQVTQSALETLAILAYRQPVTRAEIEELRGVDVSGVLNTLVERGLVKIVGRKEIPGRPFLYGTTEKFLEHFGLKSLENLPNIQEIKNLVESSVKREALLGTPKMVEMPQEEAPAEVRSVESPTDDFEQAAVEESHESQ